MAFEETSGERRDKVRGRLQTGQLQLQFSTPTGAYQCITVEVFDAGEGGVGVVSATNLSLHAEVLLVGDWGNGDKRQRASVRWCRQTQNDRFRMGLLFVGNPVETENPESTKKSTETITAPPDEDWESFDDYYELLQLHPKADPDTIHRVYRLMAQRYHPDNKESGNAERFRVLTDAYKVLSDPEQRSAHDLRTQTHRTRRWKIFDQDSASNGVGDEKRKRAGALGALYTKRLREPESATLSIQELEELLGVPREHLEFTLWYLKEQGQIVRTDSGKYSITIKGVDAAEECQMSWKPATSKLLESPASAVA